MTIHGVGMDFFWNYTLSIAKRSTSFESLKAKGHGGQFTLDLLSLNQIEVCIPNCSNIRGNLVGL